MQMMSFLLTFNLDVRCHGVWFYKIDL